MAYDHYHDPCASNATYSITSSAASLEPQEFTMTEEEKAALARRGFTVGNVIGQGAFGTVYRGDHYGKICAIKVIDMMENTNTVYVRNEMFVLKKFRHKYMVSVLEFFFVKPQNLLIFMEFVDGGNLGQLLQKYEVTEEQAAELYGQFGSALAYLHSNGFAHCDLKPDNILVNKEKTVAKLADFGLASVSYDVATGKPKKTKTCVGTPKYMAPEVIHLNAWKEESDDVFIIKPRPFCPIQTDIWSMGIILYELLHGYGNYPYDPDCDTYLDLYYSITVRVMDEWSPFNLGENDVKISRSAKRFIKRHLALSPKARPEMEALLKDKWVIKRGKV